MMCMTSKYLVLLNMVTSDPTAVPWPLHKLADGPDISFEVLPLANNITFIYAAQFFSAQLSLIQLKGANVVAQSTIDTSEGEMYDVKVTPRNPASSAGLPFSTLQKQRCF